MSFVHLDVRSYFSLKDGAFSPEDLARRAAELGMPAVAMTDRDGLYGAARFVDACRRNGVRPILGSTLTLRSRGADASTVVLARDTGGYANLCRLITDAHHNGERGDPHLFDAQLLGHAGGLVALLGPESLPGRLALAGRHDEAVRAARPYREAFGPWAFVSVRNRLEPASRRQLRALLRLAEESGLRAVATNGVRYLVREDAFLADALECMREIVPLASGTTSRGQRRGLLEVPATRCARLFAERPGPRRRRDPRDRRACTFDLGDRRGRTSPDFPTPPGRSAGLGPGRAVLAGSGPAGHEAPPARSATAWTTSWAMIQTMGYAAYFLTVADIVDRHPRHGYPRAPAGAPRRARWSATSPRISDVDPVRHGLLFERFLNPRREELPDIDIDVESARREDVYDAILSRYGEDRVACVTMVDTYRARWRIREVGKALGLPEGEIDVVAKAFPHIARRPHSRGHGAASPSSPGSNLNAGQLELLFDVAERLDGFPRHLALHPCGIVLSRRDLRRPGAAGASRSRASGWSRPTRTTSSCSGLLKLDVLGVRMLSSMRHCLDEVARVDGREGRPRRDRPATTPTRSS